MFALDELAASLLRASLDQKDVTRQAVIPCPGGGSVAELRDLRKSLGEFLYERLLEEFEAFDSI